MQHKIQWSENLPALLISYTPGSVGLRGTPATLGNHMPLTSHSCVL